MKVSSAAAVAPQNEEKTLIHFQNGIYGFEEVKDFVLLQEDDKKVIWSLQAADSSYPALIVLDPFLVLRDYNPHLSADDLNALGDPGPDDLCFLAVAVIRKKLADSVVNLKSPIVINVKNRKGIQVILDNSNYPVRYKPFLKFHKEAT